MVLQCGSGAIKVSQYQLELEQRSATGEQIATYTWLTSGSTLLTVGCPFHRHNGDVAIRPQATTDPDVRRRLLRLHQARRGLTLTEARVLYRVAQGEVDEEKLSNPDGVALNRLRRAGLVTEDVRPGLTTDTASGLER